MNMTDRLLPQHQKLLTDRAVPLDLALDAGLWSATDKAQLDKNGFHHIEPPALVIPWRTKELNGHDAPHSQIRPDVPPEGGPKYLTELGAVNRLYITPDSVELLGDPDVPLFVVEGPLKALALKHALRPACVVGVAGVWGWRGKNTHGGKVIVPDFEDIALNGRYVVLVFDSDAWQKPNLRPALSRLGKWMTGREATVHVTKLPHAEDGTKQGVDDALAAGWTAAALKAVTVPLADMVPKMSELTFAYADLVAMGDPEPDWLVTGWLARGWLTGFAARDKSGKNELLSAMVSSASRGESFLGHETSPFRLLLLTEEDRSQLIDKFGRWGLTGDEVRVVLWQDFPKLSWEEAIEQAVETALALDRDCIVIDTWAKWTKVRDENGPEMGEMADQLQGFARQTGLAAGFLHHHRKMDGELEDKWRGHTSLKGSLDVALSMEKVRDHEWQRDILTEGRVWKHNGTIRAELDIHEPKYTLLGDRDVIREAAQKAGAAQRKVKTMDETVAAMKKHDGSITARELSDEVGVAVRGAQARLKKLLDGGYVTKDGGTWTLTPRAEMLGIAELPAAS